MKREIIFLCLMIIFSINWVSAIYTCSQEGKVIEDTDEIKEGARKTVDEIGIALVNADEISALGRIIAQIIIDAQIVSLSNETPSQSIELKSGTYSVSLVNVTNDKATIKIDDYSVSMEERESTDIGPLEVFLKKANGVYPGVTDVELIAGVAKLTLSNDEKPFEKVSINDTDYLIELFSGSDNDATIIVKRCKGGNWTEEPEIIPNNTLQNITESNNITKSNQSLNETAELSEAKMVISTKNQTGAECLITGTKKDGKYCLENGTYINQKGENGNCTLNYECKSDKCKAGKCEGLGFFARIIDWFKGLFK